MKVPAWEALAHASGFQGGQPTGAELTKRSSSSSPEEKYREFLEVMDTKIDRKYPGVFEVRFGKPSENVVEGLMITKADVEGYLFVVGSCSWSGGVQGGV